MGRAYIVKSWLSIKMMGSHVYIPQEHGGQQRPIYGPWLDHQEAHTHLIDLIAKNLANTGVLLEITFCKFSVWGNMELDCYFVNSRKNISNGRMTMLSLPITKLFCLHELRNYAKTSSKVQERKEGEICMPLSSSPRNTAHSLKPTH